MTETSGEGSLRLRGLILSAFLLKPLEKASGRRRSVLEVLDALIAKVNADRSFGDNVLELLGRIEDPAGLVPGHRIEDLARKRERAQPKAIRKGGDRERAGGAPWKIRKIRRMADQ